jgi:hypothetical protein
MRQEAMHAQSGSTSQTPRVKVVAKLKTAIAISALRRFRSFRFLHRSPAAFLSPFLDGSHPEVSINHFVDGFALVCHG